MCCTTSPAEPPPQPPPMGTMPAPPLAKCTIGGSGTAGSGPRACTGCGRASAAHSARISARSDGSGCRSCWCSSRWCRFRVACEVRPGRRAAMRPHLQPKRSTPAKIASSSRAVQLEPIRDGFSSEQAGWSAGEGGEPSADSSASSVGDSMGSERWVTEAAVQATGTGAWHEGPVSRATRAVGGRASSGAPAAAIPPTAAAGAASLAGAAAAAAAPAPEAHALPDSEQTGAACSPVGAPAPAGAWSAATCGPLLASNQRCRCCRRIFSSVAFGFALATMHTCIFLGSPQREHLYATGSCRHSGVRPAGAPCPSSIAPARSGEALGALSSTPPPTSTCALSAAEPLLATPCSLFLA
eukprot:scaffold3819_cov107-Isochrysis_galbana.AAC.13